MLDVHSFLVKPMQRLTQYPMILKEVRKSFDKTTEEFALLTEAIDKCDQMLQANIIDARHLITVYSTILLNQVGIMSPIAITYFKASTRSLIVHKKLKLLPLFKF